MVTIHPSHSTILEAEFTRRECAVIDDVQSGIYSDTSDHLDESVCNIVDDGSAYVLAISRTVID